jgi:hypothetical protein
MTSLKRSVGWILMVGTGAGLLLLAFVWTFASLRTPDEPALEGEERAVGFFDPHLHIRLIEVTALDPAVDTVPVAGGHRRYAVRLIARSSAVERFADPARLSITVRDGGRRVSPSSFGPAEIDGVPVMVRFERVLEAGERQEAWLLFDLPGDLEAPELWLSKDSWLAANLPGWESSPLHDKVVFALERADP